MTKVNISIDARKKIEKDGLMKASLSDRLLIPTLIYYSKSYFTYPDGSTAECGDGFMLSFKEKADIVIDIDIETFEIAGIDDFLSIALSKPVPSNNGLLEIFLENGIIKRKLS